MRARESFIIKLQELARGEELPEGKLKGKELERMIEDGVLVARVNGGRRRWRVSDTQTFPGYLRSVFGIRDLDAMSSLTGNADIRKAEQVNACGDSKWKQTRSFKGFLVNCAKPVKVSVGGLNIQLTPMDGMCLFVQDYEDFRIGPDVIIAGMENPENFRRAAAMDAFMRKTMKTDAPILFMSRYPQTQCLDFRRWMQSVPNRYVHAGDLDLAGVRIFLTEYKPYLGERAEYFIPDDYEERIRSGTPERYDTQVRTCGSLETDDEALGELISCIRRYRKGYDQEGYCI